jgi:hypothetical protein
LVANALYSWKEPKSFNKPSSKLRSTKYRSKFFTPSRVPALNCLILRCLGSIPKRYFCCEKTKYSVYTDVLDKTDTDIVRNLNIVFLIRRMRLYNYLFSLLFKLPVVNVIASSSKQI